ncbi:MAG: SBP domain-containing protein, partial [Monoraphidium minutum]
GVCQVDGCYGDLTGLREYHQRYRICEYHLKAPSIMRDDQSQRFCQQCGRFHGVAEFDGMKRSCRSRLLKHNARRRKR